MNVTLECGQHDLTMWFGKPKPSAEAKPVDGMPQCEILTEHGRGLCGFRFCSDLAKLCPYELAKLSASNSGEQIDATIQSTYDSSCDMGYLYFDKRGASSVKHSIDCGSVVIRHVARSNNDGRKITNACNGITISRRSGRF